MNSSTSLLTHRSSGECKLPVLSLAVGWIEERSLTPTNLSIKLYSAAGKGRLSQPLGLATNAEDGGEAVQKGGVTNGANGAIPLS